MRLKTRPYKKKIKKLKKSVDKENTMCYNKYIS